MKKFTKVLLASSMLVGLAACGKTDPAPVIVTWRTTVQNFLIENGIKDAELPDLNDDCFKNIKITASKEHDEYGDYVVVVLDTEKPSEIGRSALLDVANADGWVEVDEDTEDYVEGGTAGYYSLTCRSNFNEDGLYATASIYVAEEDCPYLDPDEGDAPYCEIWYEILDDSVSAAEATELIDGLTEFYGEEESLIKESADLASVSPYWTVEAEYQDMSGVVCEQIAANYGGTYDELFSMLLECSYYDMDVHGETAEAAIEDLFNHIKNESSYGLKVDEEVTYDEEDDSYYALFVDQNESLCVQLSSYEFFGSITVGLMGYAISEEALQLSSIELHANDFSAPFNENSELCDAMLDVVNDSDYDLDSSIAKEWFYELTGTIDKNNQAVVAIFNNQIFDFTFSVGYMGARTEFPETEINALFADFTTEIPTLDGKFDVERIEDEDFGSVIAVLGYDNVPSSSPDSFGSKLLKQFREASEEWEINEQVDEDGTTYLINSVERKNNKQIRVQLSFYDLIPEERGWGVTKPLMEVYFYAVTAPSAFNVEHVKEYYNELGIVLDDVPALDGEIFYEAIDDDGTLVFYANKTGLPEVFAAKLEESCKNLTDGPIYVIDDPKLLMPTEAEAKDCTGSTYSSCGRTVCNWYAANIACAYLKTKNILVSYIIHFLYDFFIVFL